MNTLTRGANTLLTRSGTVDVHLRWKSQQVDLEVVCFAVAASGKVLTDEWFLFYNQSNSPGNAIRFSRQPGASQVQFVVNLDQLPSDIQRCVFAAAVDNGGFRNVSDAGITAIPQTGEALTFSITDVSNEQALIFAEIYRHNSGWKMRAIGQGFKGGLRPLAEHYGVVIADEQPSRPPSPLPSPAPSPSQSGRVRPSFPVPPITPLPPVPSVPGRRRSAFLRKAVISMALTLLLMVTAFMALNYYYPQLLFLVSPRLSTLINTPPDIPPTQSQPVAKAYVAPTCTLTDDQVFERYHMLGENYVRILKIVDVSNEYLTKVREELRVLETGCPPPFVDKNKQEIEKLEKLPVQGWIEETTRLNICAGIMIKKVDNEVKSESRPTVIQRLVRNADRSRNLESDLTNISRDLAYLNNKAGRLIEGYKSNLEACQK